MDLNYLKKSALIHYYLAKKLLLGTTDEFHYREPFSCIKNELSLLKTNTDIGLPHLQSADGLQQLFSKNLVLLKDGRSHLRYFTLTIKRNNNFYQL